MIQLYGCHRYGKQILEFNFIGFLILLIELSHCQALAQIVVLKIYFASTTIYYTIHPAIKESFDLHVGIQIELKTDVVSTIFSILWMETGRPKDLLLTGAYASLWQAGLITV